MDAKDIGIITAMNSISQCTTIPGLRCIHANYQQIHESRVGHLNILYNEVTLEEIQSYRMNDFEGNPIIENEMTSKEIPSQGNATRLS